MIVYGSELEFKTKLFSGGKNVRPEKKLKILNLARNGKMVILSEWDRLKPVIFIDLG